MPISRRSLLALALGGAAGAAAGFPLRRLARPDPLARPLLRPPGACAEREFLSRCIRCGQCVAVCPNRCLRLAGPEHGIGRLRTPYIEPRAKSCILCMRCTRVCPTDALEPIAATDEAVLERVDMGTAMVNRGLCYSYNDRTCGVCLRACPYPDEALKLEVGERPVVVPEVCIGCGACEEACIHIPQAIRVLPRKPGEAPRPRRARRVEPRGPDPWGEGGHVVGEIGDGFDE